MTLASILFFCWLGELYLGLLYWRNLILLLMEELAKRVEELERRVQHLEAVLQYQARKNKWALLPTNQYMEYQKGTWPQIPLIIGEMMEFVVELME